MTNVKPILTNFDQDFVKSVVIMLIHSEHIYPVLKFARMALQPLGLVTQPPEDDDSLVSCTVTKGRQIAKPNQYLQFSRAER